MERVCSSIFNDVLGPVMNGPSSSHSAGCARIGIMTRCLYGKDITQADVVFEELGSYPSTYVGQGSNFGFTGGLIGIPAEDPRLKDAVSIAKEQGRKIAFKKASLGFKHPNQARIDVFAADGHKEFSVMTYSIGGGMFQITELDEFQVVIDGSNRQVFICCETSEGITLAEVALERIGAAWSTQRVKNRTLYTVPLTRTQNCDSILALRGQPGISSVRIAEVIMPVARKAVKDVPFNATETMTYAAGNGKSLWELAVEYECGIGYVTPEQVQNLAQHTLDVMRAAVIPPEESVKKMEFLPCRCREMETQYQKIHFPDVGVLGRVMLAAVGVMENSCTHRIVAAAPTAGSSGVVPAAVVTLGDQMGLPDEEIRKGLLAAGLVGAFIANQATFGGEVGACQAENGSASAMAAAGVVQLLNGTVEQSFQAASLAMQNMLGLICDPVAGLTEIPCIGRNVSSATNAIMSAYMVLCGFNPVIPLDETIITMGRVGEQLPEELRCTCRGGLCVSPTGCKITQEVEATRPKL